MQTHVTLTTWKQHHLTNLIRLANNPKIAQTMGARFPFPYTLQHATEWLNMVTPNQIYRWAIEVDDELVGSIVLKEITHVTPSIGIIVYWIGEQHWGKGIATDAVKQVVTFAFEQAQFIKIETPVLPWNVSSIKVLKKCGFTKKDTSKHHMVKDGKAIECDLYFIMSKSI